MEFAFMEKAICDTIKEQQIKLGYEYETLRLYYPLSSLGHLLGIDRPEQEIVNQFLGRFVTEVKDRLGKIKITRVQERYCLMIPPEGVRYVHENVRDNPFLIDLIQAVSKHDGTLDELLQVFYRYSTDVECIHTQNPEYEYVIYFKDETYDPYRYCVSFDQGHISYHRFTIRDYNTLISE